MAWEKKQGCVYFFRHKGLSPVKVGYSTNKNPNKRFEQFSTYAPFGGEILAFESSSMAREIERSIHEKYADKRLNGEWFDLTSKEIEEEIEIIRKIEALHE